MPKSVNQKILDESVKHQIALQRLAEGEADSVVRTLNDFDGDIINAIYKRAGSTGLLTDARVSQIIKDVRKINGKAYEGVNTKLKTDMASFADYEARFQAGVVSDALPVDVTITLPKQKVLKELVTEEPIHGSLVDEWTEGMEAGRFNRIRQAIRVGVTQGETVSQIAARLRGTKKNNYQDGVFAVSRRSAQSITRTATNHALNQGKDALYGENPDLVPKIMLVAVIDGKTTDYCLSVNGTIYPSDEGPRPPFHINCRTNAVPVLPSADELGLDDLTTRQEDSLDGEDPVVPTYEDWLALQDDETVDDIIGPVRRRMFREGKLRQTKYRDYWGKRYTLKDLEAIDKKRVAMPKDPWRFPKRIATRRRANLGWVPDLPDHRDFPYFDTHAPEDDIILPARISLRKRMPPVFDQGDLGSCTANALVAAVMFAHGPDTPMLSRLDLYWDERKIEDTINEDAGAEIRSGVKSLAKWGVMPEKLWPYKVRRYKLTPPADGQELALDYKITSYSRLNGRDDFMTCLADGYPFVIGFTVFQNWESPLVEKKGLLSMPTADQKQIGGHAALVVGFDTAFIENPAFKKSGLMPQDIPQDVMFEVRNSFGESWGDEGYFWVPASYFENKDLADDAWTIRKTDDSTVIIPKKPAKAPRSRVRKFGYNPNHDPDTGEFIGDGGGGGGHAQDAKEGSGSAAKWLSGATAKAVLSKAFSKDNVKTAVALGIKSALYHLGNLDDPAMAVLEPYIEHHVHNIETTLAVSKGKAHDMMIAGMKKLMAAKAKEHADGG